MIALFGSGLGGQWNTSWMETSHPHPFFFSQLPSNEQSRLPHTPLTSGPQQWSTQTGLKSPRSELRGPSLFMLFCSGVHAEWWNIWLTQLENVNKKETHVYSGDYVLPFSLSMAVCFAGHSSKPGFPPSTLTYCSFLSTKGHVHRGLGRWTYQCWICTECALVSNILTPNNSE